MGSSLVSKLSLFWLPPVLGPTVKWFLQPSYLHGRIWPEGFCARCPQERAEPGGAWAWDGPALLIGGM